MKKTDFAIMRLKEMVLCNKHQNVIISIEDGNIVLDIVCNEIIIMGDLKCC